MSKEDRIATAVLLYIIFSVWFLSFVLFDIWGSFERRIIPVIVILAIPCIAGTLLGYVCGKIHCEAGAGIKVKAFFFIFTVFIISVYIAYFNRFRGMIVRLIRASNASSSYHQDINILMLVVFAAALVIGSLLGYYSKPLLSRFTRQQKSPEK